MRTVVSMSVAVVCLVMGLTLVTCGNPGGGGGGGGGGGTATGDVNVHVQDASGEQTFNYASTDELKVTPPAAGVFTATFVHEDPRLSLEIRIDSNRMAEGQRITFPLSGGLSTDDARIVIGYSDKTYSTVTSGSTGDLNLDILSVTDDAVDFRGTFNVSLVGDGGGTLTASGFLEVHDGAGGFGDLDGGGGL